MMSPLNATTTKEESPLATILRKQILENGPISVADYMEQCLAHPKYGYYMTQDPFGRTGDFITAPEISQMFGEMIGLWITDQWQRLSKPTFLNLIELGPGRGTLMHDLLRSIPADLKQAIQVHLVESSPQLTQIQQEKLEGYKVIWHNSFEDLKSLEGSDPTYIIANEFFDALPIHQFIFDQNHWWERGINWDGSKFYFDQINPSIPVPQDLPNLPLQGDILEVSPATQSILNILGNLLNQAETGGILVIDYGYAKTAFGDTLQALKNHLYVSVLDDQGLSDMTAHVNFDRIANAAQTNELQVFGPTTQGRFLTEIGLPIRAHLLAQKATDAQVVEIKKATERLLSPEQMGSLFKVIALMKSAAPSPIGFDVLT